MFIGSGVCEELNSEQVVRDVLCCSSREHVDFTIEVLRQAFLLPFSHAAAVRRVIALYKDWIQMNVCIIFILVLLNLFKLISYRRIYINTILYFSWGLNLYYMENKHIIFRNLKQVLLRKYTYFNDLFITYGFFPRIHIIIDAYTL